MATSRQKKNRYFKNLEYRFYCRNGYLPDRHEEFEVFGHKHSRDFAVLRLQSTKYLRNQFSEIAYAFSDTRNFGLCKLLSTIMISASSSLISLISTGTFVSPALIDAYFLRCPARISYVSMPYLSV